MTQVRLQEAGRTLTLAVCGHAGYAQQNDVVCAALSALSCTLVQCLKEAQAAGDLHSLDIAVRSAQLQLQLCATPQGKAGVWQTVRTVMTGYELLAQAYPQHVRVTGKKRK